MLVGMHVVIVSVSLSQLSWLVLHVSVRVAEYLDVDEKPSDVPPVLMTKDVLAKFRTMEAQSQQQPAPQQRHVCAHCLRLMFTTRNT